MQNPQIQSIYEALIMRPVRRWYLKPLGTAFDDLDTPRQRAVIDQAVIGWLQTVLLVVAVCQSLFAGVLAVLPPDLRTALGFLHRIEWAVYIAMVLVGAQAVRGYTFNLIVTNRVYALGWRFGKMQIVRDTRVRMLAIAYGVLILLMAIAVIYVRMNGFIVRPAP